MDPQKTEFPSEDVLKGYIKAAEAKKRLNMYQKTQHLKKQKEIRYLITMQPTALQGVRLESLMKPLVLPKFADPLSKAERKRLESILQDEPKWLQPNNY